ncbi:HsdM family class I SAM-dependent methyltransferase [Limosilactobacillus fastidiosus]|uniref:site-specific DNA-methyltransferase (adenine-specific) n=1 Tax=Limosilactobacillus fastidiosus TaxID=2759855 RepID=A0A7W3U0A4_9LACO|nr:N-6 DNA methylase [Limosilactobacillus fastidiosus]MBB1086305.1 N-6 DNA methylase [Limosilactobacillus fastidiosus]MCD7086409.1 SAM-dependent methyltransferase [Limosilactobacillus fastidiosus]MCD7114235.1 SAM-dependent methyltransferase [Limosilactobacillus fastidiosus]MCD7116141.1 SAM-dependent methyltransferase [Limosilactobacillus fastidiosus]
MVKSVEEKVEEHYKRLFDTYEIRHYGKTEQINEEISNGLKLATSKSGGKGNNYPDIQLLLDNGYSRRIPVMVEAKGGKRKLEHLKDGKIVQETEWTSDSKPNAKNPHKKGDKNYSAITTYAVNGALHYGLAILQNTSFKEVIIIGVNGTSVDENGNVTDPETKAYYLSKNNNYVPKHIKELDDSLVLLKQENLSKLYDILDKLTLSEEELNKLKASTEAELEAKIKAIHQKLYEDKSLKTILSTNQKLYAFTGLIMAGLSTKGMSRLSLAELTSNNNEKSNDGSKVLEHISAFLDARNASQSKIDLIISLLGNNVFKNKSMWQPTNGESLIKSLYRQISEDIIPLLESDLHLDFTGKILNSLNDWVAIENDSANDVVLTPSYLTHFMAHLARTDKDSFVWDLAMGSGGFLVAAMDTMIKDAKNNIQDKQELEDKIKNIKEHQLLGVEILGNVYILAVLNMILMGDGSTNLLNDDSHKLYKDIDFPANVFLLNPPYSADGKGFIFVQEALSQMTKGYAAILIQENAGSGNGLPFTKEILKNNTLLASIHLPSDVFSGKASVQAAIYLFKVARPHEVDDLVTFIDMSEDGYSRQNRRKSSQEVNLRDTDHAKERYAEIEARLLGKKPKTNYYTEENGKIIKDTITLQGNDWTFGQHQVIDTTPTHEDFKTVVADYLAWKVSSVLRGEA